MWFRGWTLRSLVLSWLTFSAFVADHLAWLPVLERKLAGLIATIESDPPFGRTLAPPMTAGDGMG